jgi:hypothetical protein
MQVHAPMEFLVKVPEELGNRRSRLVGRQQLSEALELAHHQERAERRGAVEDLAADRARLIELALLDQC